MRRFILVLVGAVLVAVLAAGCGGASQSASETTTTGGVQGDFVALLPDGQTRVALSTDGQQLLAYACDGDDSHSPTFARWFRGPVSGSGVDLVSTVGGDRLQATLTSQNATGTITLKDGTTLDFTAEPLTDSENAAGSSLYRSEPTIDNIPYLAGWIVDKPSSGDDPHEGGAIVDRQTEELTDAPVLTDSEVSAKQVKVPNVGTFPLTKCQQGTCS